LKLENNKLAIAKKTRNAITLFHMKNNMTLK